MTHYAKLATLGFRVVAIVVFLYAVFVFFILLRIAITSGGSAAMSLPAVAGLASGILVYLIAPLLGRVAALGLTPTAAPPNER